MYGAAVDVDQVLRAIQSVVDQMARAGELGQRAVREPGCGVFGSSANRSCSVTHNDSYPMSRANSEMPTADKTEYESGIAADTASPRERLEADRSFQGDAHNASPADRADAWMTVHVVGAIIVRLAGGPDRGCRTASSPTA